MKTIEIDGKEVSGENLHRDEDVLRELYVRRQLPESEVGEVLGVARTTIQGWLDRHGIEKRTRKESNEIRRGECPWRDEDTLRELYVEQGLTLEETAEKLDVCQWTVHHWLNRNGIKTRSLEEAWPLRRSEWMKEPLPFRTSSNGYEVWVHEYEREIDTILVHRLIAVAEYGFDAVVGNVVHHGVESDLPATECRWANWPGNLRLFSPSGHASYHAGTLDAADHPNGQNEEGK